MCTDVFISLRDMILLLPAALCVLLTVSCVRADEELPAPQDVRFHSVNLRNMVRWSSGTADTQGTSYTVEYAIYGDAVEVEGSEQVVWRPVQQCTDVTQTECDVTEQTGDTEEEYYVRVRANRPKGRSEWTETDRRLRLADTILGPPQVNVSVVEDKLQVKLSGPFRWRNLEKKRQSMFNIFPHMSYNISVYNNSSKHMHFLQPKKLLLHGPLEYNTEYCVRAEVVSLSLHLTNIQSDWICVSTADDPFKSQMMLLMLGGILPTSVCLFVLVVVLGFAYYYICGHKPRLPKSMKVIQQDVDKDVEKKLQTFQPEKHPTINVIIINNTNLNMGESKCGFLGSFHGGVHIPKPLQLPEVSETIGGAYAVQNIPQTSEAEAESDSQSCRSSLKEDYCLVHQEDRNQLTRCPNNPQVVTSYMAQTEKTEQAQEGNEEEEEEFMQTTFCNWDRDTGQLQLDFPLLRSFRFETPETTEMQTSRTLSQLPRRPDLTSVVVKQASEETGDDDLLLMMEEQWDLQVQSSTE
ncbi:interleukin-20 receptor subunit alpha isoform X2 [Tachysurus vachellii]|uniref:interleukin-20 receptor subunit alpha isoform X2 n=1 Tax=Tachysurus vachellii TaxID=175792 RepID=UPI00296AEC12|nr:interleukin-20 receptor subunit alpha isoform X2 [Tachysurus vachellii]